MKTQVQTGQLITQVTKLLYSRVMDQMQSDQTPCFTVISCACTPSPEMNGNWLKIKQERVGHLSVSNSSFMMQLKYLFFCDVF